jgi:hypothetical protein
MLGCIQPMSSPMMKRMLGFCAGCCAAAGVLIGPDSGISIDALNRAAHDRLSQPKGLFGGAAGGLSANTDFNMVLLSLL